VVLQQQLLAIPAVIDSGLFIGMTDTVLVGHAEGVRQLER
jgi:ribose 5-phosphate isomerase